ncbi:phytoene desaturase family protein [Bacillus sp. AK128]
MSKTVCIIGAGIGGLTAGAYLAKEGFQVTVLEKASTVGGSAGAYIRKNRIFPTGATIAFGLEEGGVLRSILNDLQVSISFEELQHPMDVVTPAGKISIYQDALLWEQELRDVFTDQQDQVLAFWRELHRIGQAVEKVVKGRVYLPIQRLADLNRLLHVILQSPTNTLRLSKYAFMTVEDLLRKYKLENLIPLRYFLDAQLMDAAQTDVKNAALLPSSLALTIYRNGSYAIENGLSTLCQTIANRMTDYGATLHLLSPVKELNYNKQQKKWEVHSKKVNGHYDVIINNSGISFGPRTSYIDEEGFSWGAFRIDALIDKENVNELKERKLPFAIQVVPTKDQQELLKNVHGPIYVTFHQSKDRLSSEVESEIMMTVSVHTIPSPWLSISTEQYKLEKERLMKDILTIINQSIPIQDHILYAEAGSPKTYKKFVGKAEVGGFPLTVRNAIIKPKSIRSSHRQLYIVGEQAFPGPGTLSAALSGYHAARAIIGES